MKSLLFFLPLIAFSQDDNAIIKKRCETDEYWKLYGTMEKCVSDLSFEDISIERRKHDRRMEELTQAETAERDQKFLKESRRELDTYLSRQQNGSWQKNPPDPIKIPSLQMQ